MNARLLSRNCLLLSLLALGCSTNKDSDTPSDSSLDCASPLSQADISLDPDEVYQVVDANSQLLSHCYESALATNPTLQGQIEVNLVIEADGHPSQVCSGGSTLPNRAVVSCVLRTFASFKFAEQKQQVATVYPVAFAPH